MKKVSILFLVLVVLGCEETAGTGKGDDVTTQDSNLEISWDQLLYEEFINEPEISGNMFFIDPINGSMENDGSSAHPWTTLEEVFSNNLVQYYRYEDKPYSEGGGKVLINEDAPIKGGDALILRSGDHGSFDTGAAGMYFDGSYLTIMAEENKTPVLTGAVFSSANYIYMNGISFIRDIKTNYTQGAINSVFISIAGNGWHGESSHIRIEDCYIATQGDWENWSEEDWINNTFTGIKSSSEYTLIKGCTLENVGNGVYFSGDNSAFYGNNITRFSVDSIRGCCSNLIIEKNKIKDSYKVSDNHDDGFQSYLLEGDSFFENVLIKENLILQSTDRTRDMSYYFQGIACFDGPYKNFQILDNIIITDHWHGIALYGCDYGRINGNIVLPLHWDSSERDEGPPRIKVADHDDGQEVVGCEAIGNVSTGINFVSTVLSRDNVIIGDKSEIDQYLKDYDNMDFSRK